jgi:hypothetical protein
MHEQPSFIAFDADLARSDPDAYRERLIALLPQYTRYGLALWEEAVTRGIVTKLEFQDSYEHHLSFLPKAYALQLAEMLGNTVKRYSGNPVTVG